MPAPEATKEEIVKHKPLSPAMRRELRSMARDGNPTDPVDWQHAPEGLWFHARDKVIGALLRRGLIVAEGGYTLTDAGRVELGSGET